ncbi:MAG: hypothetical protein ACO31Z_03735 [Litorivicinaceae bacterium]
MCGDLEGQHEIGSFHDFIQLALDGVVTGQVPVNAEWARTVAGLPHQRANNEFMAQIFQMTRALVNQTPESQQPERIAQLAQVLARASGVLAGLLVDDGSLQRIGLHQFLGGVEQGRTIEHALTNPTHNHSHDHDHGHSHHDHHHH